MALSADLRTELIDLFTVILTADEHTVDLPQATQIVGGCSRLQAVLAARDATFAPVMRRLEIQAAQTRPPADSSDPTDQVDDDGHSQADGSNEEVPALGDIPEPVPPAPSPAPVVPRVSAREQRRRDTRSRWLAFFEAFAAALSAGRVTPEHADVLAAACERLDDRITAELRADEAALVAVAERYGPEALASAISDRVEAIRSDRGQTLFQQQLAESRAWLRLDPLTGLYHLHGIIDPQRGELLQSALDQRVTQLQADSANSGRSYGQLVLQALLDLVHGRATVTPRALVVVDERTARTGVQHPDTMCENIDGARLPIDVALAACASGNVTAAIIDRAGKPADLTTSQPLATADQRVELRALYRDCVHPDCSMPFSKCHQHHVTFREHKGPSAVSNFVPVCMHHHHDIHDRGWRLTIDAERTLRWYRPDGTLYAEIVQTRLDGRPTSRVADDQRTPDRRRNDDQHPPDPAASGPKPPADRPSAAAPAAAAGSPQTTAPASPQTTAPTRLRIAATTSPGTAATTSPRSATSAQTPTGPTTPPRSAATTPPGTAATAPPGTAATAQHPAEPTTAHPTAATTSPGTAATAQHPTEPTTAHPTAATTSPGTAATAPPGTVATAPPGTAATAPPGTVATAPPGTVATAPPGTAATAARPTAAIAQPETAATMQTQATPTTPPQPAPLESAAPESAASVSAETVAGRAEAGADQPQPDESPPAQRRRPAA